MILVFSGIPRRSAATATRSMAMMHKATCTVIFLMPLMVCLSKHTRFFSLEFTHSMEDLLHVAQVQPGRYEGYFPKSLHP